MNNTVKKQVEKEETVNPTVVKNPEPEVAPQAAPMIVPPAPEPELTLEQKISKVEDLTMVIDRWRKLIESRRFERIGGIFWRSKGNPIFTRNSNFLNDIRRFKS